MEKEYIVELRVTVDEDDIKTYGSVEEMIYQVAGNIFLFDIGDCREIED